MRPNRLMTRGGGLAGLLLLLLTLAVGLIRAQVIPTNEWVNFFSANSTFLGQPVPAGAVIAAFDSSTPPVQCGEFTVLVEGAYGLMPCYSDEKPPTPTPDLVDEGADPGDVIHFTINGFPATPEAVSLNGVDARGTPVTWTSFGDLWEVNLHVVASPTPTATGTPVTPSPTATATASPTATATRIPLLADLSVTKGVDKPAPTVGENISFTLTAQNAGPADATNVAVIDLLPAGATFVSASASQGTCVQTNSSVVCALGTLSSGAQATMTIIVRFNVAGNFINTATVSGNQVDPDSANNVASATITVGPTSTPSPTVTPTPTPTVLVGRPVGGYAERLSALELLAPWVTLMTGIAAAGIGAVWVRQRIAA